jgi:hypothetical protein
MHRLVIDVNENVLDKIIYFLQNLPKKDVKVVEDHVLQEKSTKDNCIDFSQFKVDAFKEIKDPVAWQRQVRDEWDCH